MKKYLTVFSAVLCLVLVIVWQIFSVSKNYYLISVAILILSLLPFFVSFEKSKPSAQELSLVASLIAIAVVSRAVFYLVPQVKPIGAVVVVSGICLGGKRGYFVGAMSAFLSNFIFGQGIWTPFQMVALGMVGLISGLIFGKIKANRILISVVGFVLTFAVYGIIVDTCSVLMMTNEPTIASALAVYGSGALFSLIFGASTFVFLLLFGEAFVKKINRLIVKYGILEV